MSSRREIRHYISDTEPLGVQVGDEWYNTRLAKLYKRTLVSGTISWLDITPTTTSIQYGMAGLPTANNTLGNVNMTLPLVSQIDPNGWWKPSSNSFVPNIAGWYQVNGQVWWNAGVGFGTSQLNSQIQKNGNTASINQANTVVIGLTSGLVTTHSLMIYCNGTTDSISLTTYSSNTTGQPIASGGILEGKSSGTFLQMHLIR